MMTLLGRELAFFLRAPQGYVIVATALFVDGLLFNAFAVGQGQRRSSEVLESFFYLVSGTTILASIFISMRLLAEERQNKTLVLLSTSALSEGQIVWGKFLAALVFLSGMTASTLYIPALILMHGKVSWGHVAAGYLGLLLLGSACLAVGTLCSALAHNQLVAAIATSTALCVLLALWWLARIAQPPLGELLAYLSLHDKHFRPFVRGIVGSSDVVFYLSLTYVALVGATRVLEARRWH